jgi:SAM-dependent methyltransferase
MTQDEIWNHNVHHQKILLSALPASCKSALDIGCGQGFLLRHVAARVDEVVAIDQHGPSLTEAARRTAHLDNVRLIEGDAMTHHFERTFDAVLSIAVLHHLPLVAALERMRQLTSPGGLVGIIGLARSTSPRDYIRDGFGAVETHIRQLRRPHTMVTAPIRDPDETYREIRVAARTVLPGARFRRHNLFRYSLLWIRPHD